MVISVISNLLRITDLPSVKVGNDKSMKDAKACWDNIRAKLEDKDEVNKSKLFAELSIEDNVSICQLEHT